MLVRIGRIEAVLLRVAVCVSDGDAPGRITGEWFVEREQQRVQLRLDAVVGDDQGAVARDRLAPGLATPGRVRFGGVAEAAIRPAVAQGEQDACVAAHVRQRGPRMPVLAAQREAVAGRTSTRLNSSHVKIAE